MRFPTTNRRSSSRRAPKSLLAGVAAAISALLVALPPASAVHRAVPRLVFPVVGPVTYSDDFGAPRSGWAHPGNDLMAAKKSLVVAVEPGKIEFWTHSASAGCMLYLYGRSGTMYEYIHLNNDLTMKNDNRGECKPGISYARGLKNGAQVAAGQPIGYVGDSGDANGIHPHLHFEVHPHGGSAVSPFPYLKRARTLLFAAPPKKAVALNLTGSYVASDPSLLTVTLMVNSLKATTGLCLENLSRKIVLALSSSTSVYDQYGNDLSLSYLSSLSPGTRLRIVTVSASPTLESELASPGALSAASVMASS
jgi:hypothetical protein